MKESEEKFERLLIATENTELIEAYCELKIKLNKTMNLALEAMTTLELKNNK